MKPKTIVELQASPESNVRFDVVNLIQNGIEVERVPVNGIADVDHIEVGSWFDWSEIKRGGTLKTVNPNVMFVVVNKVAACHVKRVKKSDWIKVRRAAIISRDRRNSLRKYVY